MKLFSARQDQPGITQSVLFAYDFTIAYCIYCWRCFKLWKAVCDRSTVLAQ